MLEIKSGKIDVMGMERGENAYSWEKELAPKFTKGYLIFVAAVYFLWIGFLSIIAIQRWFGSLQ